MEKKTFTIRVAIWVAVIAALISAVLCVAIPGRTEPTLFGEVAKDVVMTVGVIGILECFVYFLAPLYWHFYIERKDEDKKG